VANVGRIKHVADAVAAVDRIKSEGEGLRDSPDQPSTGDSGHAHYYLFKELLVQRRLISVGGASTFTGPSIRRPEIYMFERAPFSQAAQQFRVIFTRLVTALERCWTLGEPPSVPMMFELEICGRKLIEIGCCPNFSWDDNL
jgi:hypothetical protein